MKSDEAMIGIFCCCQHAGDSDNTSRDGQEVTSYSLGCHRGPGRHRVKVFRVQAGSVRSCSTGVDHALELAQLTHSTLPPEIYAVVFFVWEEGVN